MPSQGDTRCILGKEEVYTAVSGGKGTWGPTGKNCTGSGSGIGSKASDKAIQRAIKQDNKDWAKGKGKYSGSPS